MRSLRFSNLRIGSRLALGFATIVLILGVAVALTQMRADEIVDRFVDITDRRLPTSHTSLVMVNDINGSLATLRGWMLTGEPALKEERAAIWANIDRNAARIDELSKTWTDPANVKNWEEFRPILEAFRQAQAKVEAIAHTPEQFPATKILVEQARPQADIMADSITLMIEVEEMLGINLDRKRLLSTMAVVQGTLAMSEANIRAYLLTGNDLFLEKFRENWTNNRKRYLKLRTKRGLLNSHQTRAFEAFLAAYDAFAPLPEQMFEIRKSEKYDMANYLLETEVEPHAAQLLAILAGDKAADGSRLGGMVENQVAELNASAEAGRRSATDLQRFLWGLLVIGAGLAVIIGFLISTSIVRPIRAMISAMGRLAEGQFGIEVPAINRRDEMGEMAKAVQVFKTNGEQIQAMERNASEIVRTLADTAGQVAGAIGQQASTTSQQAAAVAQTSTALEEIGETARAAMDQAKELSDAAEQTLERGLSGRQDMEQVIQAMNDIRDRVEAIAHTMMALSEQTRRVGEITDSVSALAQQSKMLAINASIEAAKAGESGRGFAVVAEEVASLAEQSEQATQQVRNVLDQIQAASEKAIFATEEGTKQVDAGVRLIQTVGGGMNDLLDVIDRTAGATRHMVDSIRQQSQGIQQVASAMDDITQGTEQIVGSTSQIREAVDGMASEVSRLADSRT